MGVGEKGTRDWVCCVGCSSVTITTGYSGCIIHLCSPFEHALCLPRLRNGGLAGLLMLHCCRCFLELAQDLRCRRAHFLEWWAWSFSRSCVPLALLCLVGEIRVWLECTHVPMTSAHPSHVHGQALLPPVNEAGSSSSLPSSCPFPRSHAGSETFCGLPHCVQNGNFVTDLAFLCRSGQAAPAPWNSWYNQQCVDPIFLQSFSFALVTGSPYWGRGGH